MTIEDISTIENSLQIQVPDEYRSIITGNLDWNGWGYVYIHPSTVIGINNEFRNGEFSSEWNISRFIIGNDAFGNALFLNLTVPNSPVYVWDHETHQESQVSLSLADFRNKLTNNEEIL